MRKCFPKHDDSTPVWAYSISSEVVCCDKTYKSGNILSERYMPTWTDKKRELQSINSNINPFRTLAKDSQTIINTQMIGIKYRDFAILSGSVIKMSTSWTSFSRS